MRILPVCLVSAVLAGVIVMPAAADEGSVLIDVGVATRADATAVLASLGDSVLSSHSIYNLASFVVDVPGDPRIWSRR